ncbi:MAG: 30S ribosome-binding factor RbfA [Candidatus Eisenbacteria bacterium]|nr:30S ribosome-binding factor RbfA [Candidatus Eisenbacteria bacterium]MCC7143141.1 30S ribosome-binding factor RbfA [Candidatus Eisenbacteria bacterium]
MKGVRMERVQEEIRRELSEILRNRVRDPRLSWVSVMRVEVAQDLSVARVYVSALGDEATQEAALRVLVGARPFLRSELGRQLTLRRTPDLIFRADKGIEYSLRISKILHELGLSDGPTQGGSDDE